MWKQICWARTSTRSQSQQKHSLAAMIVGNISIDTLTNTTQAKSGFSNISLLSLLEGASFYNDST